jgi:hypothetical protein
MNAEQKILNTKGYFCDYCEEFFHADDLLTRMTVEYFGEYHGQEVRVENKRSLCPECRRDEELYEFNPYHWTELKSFLAKEKVQAMFVYPIYAQREDMVPLSYATTEDPEQVEEYARKIDLCIDVELIKQHNYIDCAVITLELC